MAGLGQVRRIMVARKFTVVGGLVALQQRLVRCAQPESVAAMIGLVATVNVARRPGLDAIVVGIGAVVSFEDVPRAHPTVEHAHENAIAPVGAIIVEEAIVVGAALDQHACRIARVDLARRDAQPVAEHVLLHDIAARIPEFQASVGRIREIVVFQDIVVRPGEHATVPDTVGLVLPQRGIGDMVEHDAAVVAVFAPAEGRVVEVVGEIATFDDPPLPILDSQAGCPPLGTNILERHPGHVLGRNGNAAKVLRRASARAEQPCAAAIDRDVRRLDDDRAIRLRRIKRHVRRNLQRRIRIAQLDNQRTILGPQLEGRAEEDHHQSETHGDAGPDLLPLAELLQPFQCLELSPDLIDLNGL